MKKTAGLFWILLLAAMLVTTAFAADGMTFQNYGIYRAEEPYAEVAATYEAWVKLPTESQEDGYCVISSINSSTFHSARLSISSENYPVLKFLDKVPNGEASHKTYSFTAAVLPVDEWVHIAVSCDFEAGVFSCYVNGELAGTKTTSFVPKVSPVKAVLGGSPEPGNTGYFKGELLSVTLYSDARTADEIKADMANVDLTDKNLMAHYDLAGKTLGDAVPDLAGNYDMIYDPMWYDDTSNEPETYAYSMVLVGDQQKLCSLHPDVLHYTYDWILANRESKKISSVIALGDITDTRDNLSEWALVQNQFKRLAGKIPLIACRGNHDRPYSATTGMDYEGYTSDIAGRYNDTNLENIYKTIKIGKTDYLFITLDYGPDDDVLAWANEVTAAHPDHKVIVVTHSYMANDGTTTDDTDPVNPISTYPTLGFGYNNGDDIWEKYVRKHENIVFVLSGHIDSDQVRATKAVGDHGNVVTQMLVDPQGIDPHIPTGMICMLYFNEDGNIVTTDCYSTIRNQYFNVTETQYTMIVGERSGDMDNDGKVTVSDVLAALRAWANGESGTNADIDGDGKVTLAEVTSIIKIAVQ